MPICCLLTGVATVHVDFVHAASAYMHVVQLAPTHWQWTALSTTVVPRTPVAPVTGGDWVQ